MAELQDILSRTRGINIQSQTTGSILKDIEHVAEQLQKQSSNREARVLQEVWQKCTGPKNFGGLSLDPNTELNHSQQREVLFLCEAWLESLNAEDRAKARPEPLHNRPEGRRGMTITEKIFAIHNVQQTGFVKPGQVIRVGVDWIMASELSWGGMKKTYDQLGKPGVRWCHIFG